MNNHESTSTIIPSRARDLGGFAVRRVLPAIGRKTVGPFIFFDHMGPVSFSPGQGMDVRPHPHIGLATVTFLFDGAILHRDSLGSAQIIKPGDVNWMTAGRGIVHSERTPAEVRRVGGLVEGIQSWIALPRGAEEVAPTFVHHADASLPQLQLGGASVRVLIGEAFGARSPVATLSDTLYLDAQMPAGSKIEIESGERELGVYAARGLIAIDREPLEQGSMFIGRQGRNLTVEANAASRVMVIGGKPLGEKREIWWNFVASSKERIAAAKAQWAEGRFPKVPGDDVEFIPLPAE